MEEILKHIEHDGQVLHADQLFIQDLNVNINEVIFVEESLKHIEQDGEVLLADQEHKVVDARLIRITLRLVDS